MTLQSITGQRRPRVPKALATVNPRLLDDALSVGIQGTNEMHLGEFLPWDATAAIGSSWPATNSAVSTTSSPANALTAGLGPIFLPHSALLSH